MAKIKGELGPLERSIMDFIWDEAREVTVRDVLTAPFATTLAYTTVMTILDRLWKKGFLSRRRSGRAYLYSSIRTRDDYLSTVVGEVLSGSTDHRSVLLGFVRGVAPEDLAELREVIREVERERKGTT